MTKADDLQVKGDFFSGNLAPKFGKYNQEGQVKEDVSYLGSI